MNTKVNIKLEDGSAASFEWNEPDTLAFITSMFDTLGGEPKVKEVCIKPVYRESSESHISSS